MRLDGGDASGRVPRSSKRGDRGVERFNAERCHTVHGGRGTDIADRNPSGLTVGLCGAGLGGGWIDSPIPRVEQVLDIRSGHCGITGFRLEVRTQRGVGLIGDHPPGTGVGCQSLENRRPALRGARSTAWLPGESAGWAPIGMMERSCSIVRPQTNKVIALGVGEKRAGKGRLGGSSSYEAEYAVVTSRITVRLIHEFRCRKEVLVAYELVCRQRKHELPRKFGWHACHQ